MWRIGVLMAFAESDHEAQSLARGVSAGTREARVDGGPKHRDNAAAKAGGLTGRRNAPAQGTRNDVASRADEAGCFAGENGEILFGKIEVPIFHARGQYGRELDVGSNAGAPAGHRLSCGKRRDCNFDVPDRNTTKAVDGDAPRGKC